MRHEMSILAQNLSRPLRVWQVRIGNLRNASLHKAIRHRDENARTIRAVWVGDDVHHERAPRFREAFTTGGGVGETEMMHPEPPAAAVSWARYASASASV